VYNQMIRRALYVAVRDKRYTYIGVKNRHENSEKMKKQTKISGELISAWRLAHNTATEGIATADGKVSSGRKTLALFIINRRALATHRSAREDGVGPRVNSPELSLL